MARLGRSDLTLVQLRYFVAAATKRSMTEASVDLHVAQSAVSTAIAQLERTLGVQLFVRQRSKGLALTEAGEQLLRDAHSLLAQVDEMAEAVRGHHYDVRGTLRLACFVTIAPFVLPTLISRVEAEHPHLRIEVIEADADGTVAMLLNGSVEAAIAYDFGELHDLAFDHLYSAPPHVILPVETERNAYFIAAESVTNATKHAEASEIVLRVAIRRIPETDMSWLDVEVVDDGVGGAGQVPGHGLAGLEERARGLGGFLELTSRPGGGTTVSAHLPLVRIV